MTAQRILWVDASAGLAGDMLLAALVDAHDDPATVRGQVERAVATVVPEVQITWQEVSRNGFRALRCLVTAVDRSPERHLDEIRRRLAEAELPSAVASQAEAVIERLAAAEAAVHGMPVEQVHLHEVGAWDSLADIVGACAALAALHVDRVVLSPIEVGSGRVWAAHGELPVPPPGVLELARGWIVQATGTGELATPTGLALATTWADPANLPTGQAQAPDPTGTGHLTELGPMPQGPPATQGPMPSGRVLAVGVGAGSADPPARANVVRAVVLDHPGTRGSTRGSPWVEASVESLVELSANVDDLDPRAWPSVLQALLAAGARDAWLTPILMKKGRPAHTVHTLATPERQAALTEALARHTTSFGVRAAEVSRVALPRGWVPVSLSGATIAVKVAHAGGRILHATPETEDVLALAQRLELSVREVLTAASAAATNSGLQVGQPVPVGLLATRPSGSISAGGQSA